MSGLLLGAAGMFATMYSSQAILPELAADFEVTPSQAGLTISVVVLAVAVAGWFWGPLSERVGRKRSLMLASGMLVLPSLGAAVAPSFPSLLVVPALQGACMPGLLTVGVPYVAEVFAPGMGGRAMGYYTIALVGGGLLGRVGVGLVTAVAVGRRGDHVARLAGHRPARARGDDARHGSRASPPRSSVSPPLARSTGASPARSTSRSTTARSQGSSPGSAGRPGAGRGSWPAPPLRCSPARPPCTGRRGPGARPRREGPGVSLASAEDGLALFDEGGRRLAVIVGGCGVQVECGLEVERVLERAGQGSVEVVLHGAKGEAWTPGEAACAFQHLGLERVGGEDVVDEAERLGLGCA